MNRRDFTKLVGLSTLAAGFSSLPAMARKPAPQFSITMDDFHWQNAVKLTATERNRAILETLRAHSIKAAHRNFNAPTTDVNAYGEDILQAEALLKEFPRFQKYFRFPMLKEGDTTVKRDAMRAFLCQRGYRNGHVTIDNSDWYIDQRLTARLKDNPAADVKPYRDYYLEHIWFRCVIPPKTVNTRPRE